MTREHNLTIDTIAASRGQRMTNDLSSDNDTEEKNRIIEDDDDDDDDDDDFSSSASPSVIDEEINFDLVYALHTFTATVEGQASVEKGESLTLLDDSNSYWWLVKVLRNDEVGYIPAETVETPYEKLARLNKHRNINISSSQNNTEQDHLDLILKSQNANKKQAREVRFKSPEYIITIEYEEEGEEEIDFGEEYYEEKKDSNDPKEQKDRIEVESADEQEEPIAEERESLDSVITVSSTSTISTTQEVTQTPGTTAEDERLQQKITGDNAQSTENKSFTEQTSYYSRPNQNENNDIQTAARPIEPTNLSTLSPDNIFDQSSETIKMSLTPALGSDFIDFSDDEDDEPKQKTGSKFFGKNDSDSSKTNNSSSNNKQTTLDAAEDKKNKGKKDKKEGGIFKSLFFKKKSKNNKKDDDSSRNSLNSSIKGAPQDPLIAKNIQPTKSLTYQQQMTNTQISYTNQSLNQPQSNIQSPAANGWQQQQLSQPPQSMNTQPQPLGLAQSPTQQQQQQTQNKQVMNPTQSPTQIPSQQPSTKQTPTATQRPGQSPTQIPSPTRSSQSSPTQTKQQPIQPNQSPTPVSQQQIRTVQTGQSNVSENRRSSNPSGSAYSVVRIFAGQNISTKVEYKIVLLSQVTNTISLIKQALKRFKLDKEENWDDYYVTIKESEREPHHLMPHDYPLEIFETLTSSYLTPLPTVKRTSISSVSSNFSNLSSHEAISKLLFRDDKNLVCLYINKKFKTDSRTNSMSSMEKKFRVRILVYSDDLPAHLRHKGTVPRVSMSVPKHLAEKAARRRSREEGKPREKAVSVTGKTTVGQIVEKAMFKFGINDAITDDGKPITGSDDGKPRYYLTMIVNGEEKYLRPEINVMSVYKAPPDLRHFSIDSLDSSSSAFDYHPDEPIFVLRLLRPEDRQKRAMPQSATEDIKRYTQNVNITQSFVDEQFTQPSQLINENATEGTVTEKVGDNDDQLSRKQLIEQQREYSRAKQKSILAAHKNDEQGVDIITSIGAIRSSRIFGAKVRYSFIPTNGEVVDISELIEDVWGDDELMTTQETSDLDDKLSTHPENDDNTFGDKKENKRRSRTAEVDILENIVNDETEETETIEQRINRVIQKVKAGQYGMSELPSITAAVRNQKESENEGQSTNTPLTTNQSPNKKQNSVSSNEKPFEQDGILAKAGASKQKLIEEPNSNNADLERPASSISNRSASTINSLESITPTRELFSTRSNGASSTTPSIAESDWVMSDEFGLQELLVLVRSGVNMLEIKERRRSGWNLNDDPDKILEQIKPSDIRDEIRTVFAGVNDELDKLELELDQIMNDAIRVF